MEVQVQANSALAYGTNRKVLRSTALAACQAIGIKRPFRPAPSRGWALQVAMRAAGETVCPKKPNLQVRPLQQPGQYEVVSVWRGLDRNVETFLFSCGFDGDTVTLIADYAFALLPATPVDLRDAVQQQFDEIRQYLSASQVLRLVARTVRHLRGVQLKGVNVHYLPPQAVDVFETWRAAAGVGSYHLTRFPISTDPETVKNVLDSLTAEVAEAAEQMMAKVAAGDLTQRQAKAISVEAGKLVAKINQYESLLQTPLAGLRDQVDAANTAASVGALLGVST